jgi:hypothetical protein
MSGMRDCGLEDEPAPRSGYTWIQNVKALEIKLFKYLIIFPVLKI